MVRKPVAPLPEEGGLHERARHRTGLKRAAVNAHRSTLLMAMAAEG